MDVGDIRTRLGVNLATVDDLHVLPHMPGSAPSTPAAVVIPDEDFIDYPETIAAGLCTLRFRVVLLAARADEQGAQRVLDVLLSAGTGQTGSAVNALVSDRTLNGEASTLVVRKAADVGTTEVGGVSFLKADLLVDVTARRS